MPSARAALRHIVTGGSSASGAAYARVRSAAPPLNCLPANRSPRPSLGRGVRCPQRAQSLCYLGAAGFFERSCIASMHQLGAGGVDQRHGLGRGQQVLTGVKPHAAQHAATEHSNTDAGGDHVTPVTRPKPLGCNRLTSTDQSARIVVIPAAKFDDVALFATAISRPGP